MPCLVQAAGEAGELSLAENVVREQLHPVLMACYRKGAINLNQLMAFCVTDDHARQERVWEGLSWNKEPSLIRRLLTEAHVKASDRRAVFVGVEAYEAAGGAVVRDLFAEDGGGWLADPALLDRLIMEKLEAEARAVADEGWKWVQPLVEFPYGHAAGMRRVWPLLRC